MPANDSFGVRLVLLLSTSVISSAFIVTSTLGPMVLGPSLIPAFSELARKRLLTSAFGNCHQLHGGER